MIIILPYKLPIAFAFLDKLHEIANKYYEDTILIPVEATSQYNLYKTFQTDNLVVTSSSMLALVGIFIVRTSSDIAICGINEGMNVSNFAYNTLDACAQLCYNYAI